MVSRLISCVVDIYQLLTCLATLPGDYMNLKVRNARLEQNGGCVKGTRFS